MTFEPSLATIPKRNELMWPTLEVLRESGSGTNREIEQKVLDLRQYSDEQRSVLHGDGPRTEMAYRMAWARFYLKSVGALESGGRAVWAITKYGRTLKEADMARIPAKANAMAKPRIALVAGNIAEPLVDLEEVEGVDSDWQAQLLEIVMNIAPAQFERLCQRVLREQGFVNVQVTGRSGDGGLDGTGVLRMQLLSFPMVFQCKRYRGSVGPDKVREFRGAVAGHGEKGLLMTTGSFTKEAVKEAQRTAPFVDLVDGEQLIEMLKELRLGVAMKQVEQVTIDTNWFGGL